MEQRELKAGETVPGQPPGMLPALNTALTSEDV
jgi:hypothetical protein